MLQSERQSFRRFLVLYGLLILMVMGLLGFFYYQSREQIMLSRTKVRLIEYAADQIRRLRHLHNHFPRENRYPRDKRFRSAIYDLEYVKIFSNLRDERVDFLRDIYRRGDVIHFVKLLDNYYLGAKYLFIEVPEDRKWIMDTLAKMAVAGMILGVLFAVLGYYLARLFTGPMRRSIRLLDDFINDATHELNTPLSSILANIEMMDPERLDARDRKRLERIAVAARTVSTLYEDLKFLTLERHRPLEEKTFDMADLLRERLEFFGVLIRSKALKVSVLMEKAPIYADRRQAARVIDNLLSNAIKYNRRGGMIGVELSPGRLEISDSGVGMGRKEMEEAFERYRRFNENEGGFGLGLDIVKRIVEEKGWEISIDSEVGRGTKVTLRWSGP